MKVYNSRKSETLIKESYNQLINMWNVPVTSLDVEGRYGTTHINVFGNEDAPPLVLFHGVGDDAALMWIYNAGELDRHFRCYAVDTIGGPGLSIPNSGYDKDFDDAVWIEETLDKLNLSKVYMAGVSNGAYLTQSFMMERPDRVIRGICMAGALPVFGKKGSMLAMLKIFFPEALFPSDKNVVKLIKKITGSNYKVFTENDAVFKHFKYLMTGFNRKAMMNHKVKGFQKEEIERLRDKCLYIEGEKDPFMILGGKKVLNDYKMNVLWIEDAGHGINHEAAHEVNSAIIDFFK
ncbi:MAG: alpha/beta hydrolase [Treponema sp.]|nr:alpha/beta hydrolase [Treponema sp.]